jgi:hypothetical protein
MVHEVGNPAEEEAERHTAGDIIVHSEPLQFLLVAQIEDSEHRTDHSSVEGHSAVPQLEDVDRVLEVVAEVVEQNVADAAAEDDSERRVEHEVVGMAASHRASRLLDQLQQVPIADENAGQVRKAVPPQLEESEVERDRIQAEIAPDDCTEY